MKNKVLNILIIIIILVITITMGLLIIKYAGNKINDTKMQEIVKQIEKIQPEIAEGTISLEIDGYNVIGIIKIEKIGLEYPILDRTDDISMKKSISKFWGPSVNEIGNLTLVGHNNKDGTMFGKTKKLEIGDLIELKNLNNQMITYKIFDKYVIEPNDVSCIESVGDNTKEVTLITCTNGNKNRLVIKAQEI